MPRWPLNDALISGGVLASFWEGLAQTKSNPESPGAVALLMIAEARRRPELLSTPAPSKAALVL
jgi:hypothetical protein